MGSRFNDMYDKLTLGEDKTAEILRKARNMEQKKPLGFKSIYITLTATAAAIALMIFGLPFLVNNGLILREQPPYTPGSGDIVIIEDLTKNELREEMYRAYLAMSNPLSSIRASASNSLDYYETVIVEGITFNIINIIAENNKAVVFIEVTAPEGFDIETIDLDLEIYRDNAGEVLNFTAVAETFKFENDKNSVYGYIEIEFEKHEPTFLLYFTDKNTQLGWGFYVKAMQEVQVSVDEQAELDFPGEADENREEIYNFKVTSNTLDLEVRILEMWGTENIMNARIEIIQPAPITNLQPGIQFRDIDFNSWQGHTEHGIGSGGWLRNHIENGRRVFDLTFSSFAAPVQGDEFELVIFCFDGEVNPAYSDGSNWDEVLNGYFTAKFTANYEPIEILVSQEQAFELALDYAVTIMEIENPELLYIELKFFESEPWYTVSIGDGEELVYYGLVCAITGVVPKG